MSVGPSQMLRGCSQWWMESLTSSRSGMMAWHLSEVLRSHCDQILLCPCFIVVTAWGMLGFVLPTVAIHHLWRKRTRAQWHFALHLHPLPLTQLAHILQHTHTLLRHPLFPTVLWPVCYTCAVKLSLLFSTLSTLHSRRALFMSPITGQRRRYAQ